ncbi:hypothetical protein BOTBODRAFT_511972 [Botryobasidium botryosum FD-172 SS1]|uniref:Uncharacterized protein n=1 Tax=Botryobasidium botryosum (strain FD-172 SS1) TaxID=930990 RepID=A0A067MS75_BOTB1|nr:hypothetical protein BOTBODRAFT_511972 [Botryobasidium botryosum FD-172 SS1]
MSDSQPFHRTALIRSLTTPKQTVSVLRGSLLEVTPVVSSSLPADPEKLWEIIEYDTGDMGPLYSFRPPETELYASIQGKAREPPNGIILTRVRFLWRTSPRDIRDYAGPLQ